MPIFTVTKDGKKVTKYHPGNAFTGLIVGEPLLEKAEANRKEAARHHAVMVECHKQFGNMKELVKDALKDMRAATIVRDYCLYETHFKDWPTELGAQLDYFFHIAQDY